MSDEATAYLLAQKPPAEAALDAEERGRALMSQPRPSHDPAKVHKPGGLMALRMHGANNLRSGRAVRNRDGTFSTIRSITIGRNGKFYLIPTVWEGRIVGDDEAIGRADASGVNWPSFATPEEAEKAAMRVSDEMGVRAGER